MTPAYVLQQLSTSTPYYRTSTSHFNASKVGRTCRQEDIRNLRSDVGVELGHSGAIIAALLDITDAVAVGACARSVGVRAVRGVPACRPPSYATVANG